MKLMHKCLLQNRLNATDSLGSQTSNLHALSLREYFSNSFVIATLILLAAVGQGSFSQSSRGAIQ